MTPDTVKVFFALANTKRNASVLGLRIKVLSRLQVADIKEMIIKMMEPSLNLTNLHVWDGMAKANQPSLYPVEWKAGEDGREKSSRTKNYGKEEGGRRKEEGGRCSRRCHGRCPGTLLRGLKLWTVYFPGVFFSCWLPGICSGKTSRRSPSGNS